MSEAMHARAAANRYRRVHIESASQSRILDELFVTLLADLDDAERLIQARDAAGKGAVINHALAILATLRGALHSQTAPALCEDLGRLYDFCSSRLFDANLRFDIDPLREARTVLRPVREAFAAAIASAPHGG